MSGFIKFLGKMAIFFIVTKITKRLGDGSMTTIAAQAL